MGGFHYVLDQDARILFVDDDPILREFAKVNLASDCTILDTAEDGAEALEMLARSSYDLIVSDLEMPRMDGFALLQSVRGAPDSRHLPVVVATGREDVLAIDRAFDLGATSFVVKPLHWRLLAYQLRFVLRAARVEARLRAGAGSEIEIAVAVVR
jgi:CheY-like chemotaxis protein